MNSAVDWALPALNGLAAASLGPAGTAAVADASHRIEQDLARDPYAVGLPGASSVSRTAVEPPLVVEFEIIEDDKVVRITRVWSIV